MRRPHRERLNGRSLSRGGCAIGHRQPHRRITNNGVTAGIIIGGPHAAQRQIIGRLAEFYFFEFDAQIRGEFRIALVEKLERRTNRVALEQPFQRAFKDLHLSASPWPHKGTPPGAFDMPYDRQCPAFRMTEQPLWQARHKRVRRNGRAFPKVRKVVQLRRAGAITGKVKRQ